jgi:multiple sugar transport system substrate-binding protein
MPGVVKTSIDLIIFSRERIVEKARIDTPGRPSVSRRSFLGLGVGAAAATAVAACGGTSGSAAGGSTAVPSSFSFSTYGDVRFYKQGFQEMQAVTPKFKKVEFVSQEATSGTAQTARLLTGIVGHAYSTIPDVCEVQWSDVERLANANVIADLTDHLKPYTSQVSQAVVEPVTVNDKIMACPWRPNTCLFWYNDKLLKEAGVDGANITTYDEYLTAAKKFSAHKFSDGKSRYMCNIEPTPTFNTMFLTQQGATLFDKKTQKLLDFRNSDEFTNAFEFQVEQARSKISISITDYSATWYQALNQGLVASILLPNWVDQDLRENAPAGKGDWRVAQLPAFGAGGGRKALYGVAVVVAINKPNLNHDLAWAFMQKSFYDKSITPKLYSKWFLEPCWYPVESGTTWNSNLAYYGGQNPGAVDLEIQKGAYQEVGSPSYAQVTAILSTALSKSQQGQASVKDAIASAWSQCTQQNIPVAS